MKNGIINLNKPKGITSCQALKQVKRSMPGGVKLGHAGTLDPLAEGVLLVLVGSATKVSGFMMGLEKEYVAEMVLGLSTDSHDSQGKIVEKNEPDVSEQRLLAVFRKYEGVQFQTPPMLSAKKFKGENLYELFRKGEEVERLPVEINVKQLELLEYVPPRVKFRIRCSKGTYVRTLCNDMGKVLGCGAHMSSLVRTRIGNFLLRDSVDISGDRPFSDLIVPVNEVMAGYPHITVNDSVLESMWFRNRISAENILNRGEVKTAVEENKNGGIFPVFDRGRNFIALAGREPGHAGERMEFRLLRVIA